jgi:hypothetical protein
MHGPNLKRWRVLHHETTHRNGATDEAEFGAAAGRCVFRVLHVSPVHNASKHSCFAGVVHAYNHTYVCHNSSCAYIQPYMRVVLFEDVCN